MKKANNQKGFTLLELIIVVGIIGAIALIATPNISSWNQSRTIQAALAAIQARIDFAKNASVSEGRQIRLVIANGNNNPLMQVRSRSNAANTPTNMNSDCRGNVGQNLANGYTEDYNFGSASVQSRHNANGNIGGRSYLAAPQNSNRYSQNNSTICFNSDGTSSMGGFLLQNENGEQRYRVDIFQTGFYSVERYVDNGQCDPNCWVEWN